jgi:hypothetical protein
MIPEYLRSFFWDIKADEFDPVSHPDYAIARVLEYGDEQAFIWLKQTFPPSAIVRVIREEHRLSRRSANFWALVYDIPAVEVAALK